MTLPAAHQDALRLHLDDEGLLGDRSMTPYNETEQQYSTLLYKRIEQLLKGERNDLLLLRKYPPEPGRLGVRELGPQPSLRNAPTGGRACKDRPPGRRPQSLHDSRRGSIPRSV